MGGGGESQHFQHTQAQNITLGGVLVLKHCQKHNFQHPQAQTIAYRDVLSQATTPPQADRSCLKTLQKSSFSTSASGVLLQSATPSQADQGGIRAANREVPEA